MKTVLCCEDSLEGILCGVYEGWAGKYGHASVALALGKPGSRNCLYATCRCQRRRNLRRRCIGQFFG